MSSCSPGRLATQKSKRGKTDDRIADDVRVVILLVGQGWLHMIGAILFPAGVAVVLLKGESFVAAPIVGSPLVVTAMALFAVIVFRTSRA